MFSPCYRHGENTPCAPGALSSSHSPKTCNLGQLLTLKKHRRQPLLPGNAQDKQWYMPPNNQAENEVAHYCTMNPERNTNIWICKAVEDYIKQQGKQDIMYDPIFYREHIGVRAKWKVALFSFSIKLHQRSAWMMEHHNLISEQKYRKA